MFRDLLHWMPHIAARSAPDFLGLPALHVRAIVEGQGDGAGNSAGRDDAADGDGALLDLLVDRRGQGNGRQRSGNDGTVGHWSELNEGIKDWSN